MSEHTGEITGRLWPDSLLRKGDGDRSRDQRLVRMVIGDQGKVMLITPSSADRGLVLILDENAVLRLTHAASAQWDWEEGASI